MCPVEPLDFLGMPLHALTFEQAVETMMTLARGDRPAYAVTANVDHVVRFVKNPEVRELYTQADLVVADGMPVVWASRFLGTPLPQRVAGSDLFPRLCAEAAVEGLSVYLLGGAPGAADGAADILRQRHPALRIVGTYCPPYGFERDRAECDRIVEAIRSADPDILFVGLGSPKQERWIVEHRVACGARLSIGVGISFSFLAGMVTRAPRWMQRLGLEWLHRIWQEPGRMARRYLIDDLPFFPMVLRARLQRRRRKP